MRSSTMIKRSYVIYALSIIALPLMFSVSMSGDVTAEQHVAEAPALYTVGAGQPGVSVTIGGSVVPYREVTLNAESPGRVIKLSGKEGDKFDQGELLLQVDNTALLAKRQAVEAQLRSTYATMRNAGVQYNRELIAPRSASPSSMPGMGMPTLFDQMFSRPFGNMSGLGGDTTLERNAEMHSKGIALEQARNLVDQTEAELRQLDAKLRNTRSIAPFDGIIVKRMVEQGDTVQPGQAMLQFADVNRMQIKVEVPSRLVSGLQKGMILPARLDVGNVRLEARVAQIFPSADRLRHSVTVKLDLPVGVPAAPGMYADVVVPDIDASSATFPIVPLSSLVWRGTLPAVYVVNDEGKKELRVVRVGELVDSKHATILSGLMVGEKLIATPVAAGGWQSNEQSGRFGHE